jgi:hypothetical protein
MVYAALYLCLVLAPGPFCDVHIHFDVRHHLQYNEMMRIFGQ